MPDTFFEPPASLVGTNAEKLQEMYRYLQRMSDQLNEAMNTLTTGRAERQEGSNQLVLTRGAAVTTPQSQAAVNNEKTYNALRSMIIKTASIIRSEMDQISVELSKDYEAISEEFGTLEERWKSTVEATATGIIQTYDYDGKIKEVGDDLDGYRKYLSQYIYMGYVDGKTVGIAIGDNVTNLDDGSLNHNNKMATFTKKELAFYVNNTKVAWFSNSTFNIAQGKVTESLQIGERHIWRVIQGGNLALGPVHAEE